MMTDIDYLKESLQSIMHAKPASPGSPIISEVQPSLAPVNYSPAYIEYVYKTHSLQHFWRKNAVADDYPLDGRTVRRPASHWLKCLHCLLCVQ